MKRAIGILTLLLFTAAVHAETDKKIDFNYENADIIKVVKDYSSASGQKFIIDPSVHGKITILNKGPVTVEEAFDQMSSALALNSLGISTQDGVMVIMQARSLQRNYIGVGKELPPLRPERMYTWIVDLKNASADEVNKQLRILTSKDGELVPYTRSNQIFVSDWVSNLYRIKTMLSDIDQKMEPAAKSHVKHR